MVARPYWRGYLKLSLVTCAVTLSPVTTEGGKVRFHTINRKTGDRIYTQYVDAKTGKAVDKEDQARAYAKAEDEYVILEDEDLDSVQLESARTIDIDEFAPADSIEWVYFDSPYFVVPADDVGEEAFSVIQQAMKEKDVVGISRLVIGNRERAVMLQPWDKGIILWTLRFGDEVRDEDEYWEKVDDHKVDSKMLGMVQKIIEDRTTSWSETMVEDPVQDELLKIIKSKSPSKKKARAKPSDDGEDEAPKATNVIDLMEALKRSLEGKPEETKKAKR
ncbi:DNA end-binding protein Ku [Devosia lucknowensis]|uniref:Non-homologous end joining protein Ku n=1 Tax=Devosia lucknowensis TaxID=1096929 RepID=A0A1Y6ESR8_9HYPH|nr:Ku protein [Devosia lucknowensis]SMQ65754.1 DNA end-binding protein Ku [Devosia lucknowensis]